MYNFFLPEDILEAGEGEEEKNYYKTLLNNIVQVLSYLKNSLNLFFGKKLILF